MSHWQGKTVVVTGGSAGLGRSIAAAFVAAGARVVVGGRDAERLEAAVRGLRGVAEQSGGEAIGVTADMTRAADAQNLVDRTLDRWGRLDVFVNNVGRSARGALVDTSPDELRRLWEDNFLTAVHGSRAAAEGLAASRGHLVNIGSLAGKSAARFLSGYPAAKFAVTAYSQQLRYEWLDRGVHVLLVCPGPIARPDAGSRYDAQADSLPESVRRPGGGVKLRGVDPDRLAQKILDACRRRRPELVVPAKARLLFAVQQLFPSLGDWILRRQTG